MSFLKQQMLYCTDDIRSLYSLPNPRFDSSRNPLPLGVSISYRSEGAAFWSAPAVDLHSFLPSLAIFDTAAHHDNMRAKEVCASIQAGEIVVFDKAYVDFEHLRDLDAHEVHWVTLAKDNMKYRAVKNQAKNKEGIIKDQIICLQIKGCAKMRVGRSECWYLTDAICDSLTRHMRLVFLAGIGSRRQPLQGGDSPGCKVRH